MQLRTIPAGDSITRIALQGRLDVQGVNEIQYEFFHQVTSLPQPTIVDVSKVTFMASLGMGMLVSAAKHLERHGVRMVLLDPAKLVRTSLEAAGLSQLIVIVAQ